MTDHTRYNPPQRTMLMLDERSVASCDRVTFHLSPATKHPQNPLLIPGAPQEWDSLQVCWPGTVLRDPKDGTFRCWYHGLDALQSARVRREPDVPWEPGFARSADGIRWERPRPNKVTTNFDGWFLSTVFPNPDPTDPNRRFLSIWKTPASFHEPQMPRALASASDGTHWTLEDPCFYREPAPRHQMQDFWQVIHDPGDPDPDFRVKAYSQYWAPRRDGSLVRQIGLHHGPDIRHLRDAVPPVVLAPVQGIDEQIHFAGVHRVGDTYLMLFESDRFSVNPPHGDLRLAVSTDGGRTFRRVHARTPLVSTGCRGMWDENLLVTTSYAMLEVNDEVRIYYFGCPNVFRNWPGGFGPPSRRGSLFYPTYLGLATVPRDRYACASGPGSVTTHPVQICDDGGGDRLWINAEGDGLRVRAGESCGKLSAERRQTVYRRVVWDRRPPLRACPIEITLATDSDRLFSVTS